MKIKWNKVLIAFYLIVLIILSGKDLTGNASNDNSLNAEIVSNTAPTQVNHYDSYTIDITVKNTGEEEWKSEDDIRLCIWQDNADWGFRVDLPPDIVVKPGEQHVFTLNDFVVPEAEETVIEFQMLKEGITYFGEREAVDIKAIE